MKFVFIWAFVSIFGKTFFNRILVLLWLQRYKWNMWAVIIRTEKKDDDHLWHTLYVSFIIELRVRTNKYHNIVHWHHHQNQIDTWRLFIRLYFCNLCRENSDQHCADSIQCQLIWIHFSLFQTSEFRGKVWVLCSTSPFFSKVRETWRKHVVCMFMR